MIDALQATWREARAPSKPPPPADGLAAAKAREDDEERRFATILLPTRFDVPRHWRSGAAPRLGRVPRAPAGDVARGFAKMLVAGIDGCPRRITSCPQATLLNAARVKHAVDLIGLDYYQKAGPGELRHHSSAARWFRAAARAPRSPGVRL
jgi:hypothetical protein